MERMTNEPVKRYSFLPGREDWADALVDARDYDAAVARIAELKEHLADHKCYRCGDAIQENHRLRSALRVIRGPEDSGPWIAIYREAGGGYQGLQAIAEHALGESASTATDAKGSPDA